MNNLSIILLKIARKIVKYIGIQNKTKNVERICDSDLASTKIYNLLLSDKPCMVARFGSSELNCLNNYLSICKDNHKIIDYILNKECDWWWNRKIINIMKNNAGFFPNDKEHIKMFCSRMISDIKQLDLLGSWLTVEEDYIKDYLGEIPKVALLYLEPYWSKTPWTRVLKGKKVLVIHPFAELIKLQYKENRTKLFKNSEVLPEFELHTIEAVQSIGGETHGFIDWFEALKWMEDEMDRTDYDIALIGCGAYGFPLAAHAKRMGKKAVHLGGALQLLFGIKGNRWENPEYGAIRLKRKNAYPELFNEYWIRPDEQDTPKAANEVEGGCYW